MILISASKMTNPFVALWLHFKLKMSVNRQIVE